MSIRADLQTLFAPSRKAATAEKGPSRNDRDDRDDDLEAAIRFTQAGEVKSFDWNHYQNMADGGGVPAAHQAEFNLSPTILALKTMYIREAWVKAALDAVSRQFMTCNFILKSAGTSDGKQAETKDHPLISLLKSPKSESPVTFHATNMVELCLTGNLFLWVRPDLTGLRRLPTERIQQKVESGRVTGYMLHAGGGADDAVFEEKAKVLILKPEEVVHIRLPNPFSHHVGLSMLIASTLPVLIDRYGKEFVIGFFLRGGNMAGVLETDTQNPQQLLRLFKTLMQAFGSRRNMHTDKVLPQGTKWAASGQKFSEIQLIELLRETRREIMAALGVPPIEVSDTDSVNYANAKEQRLNFWEKTILPLQKIYASGLRDSILGSRFRLVPGQELAFDNSHVEVLSDFGKKLEEDVKLKGILPIGRRLERLGLDPIGDDRDGKLESELGNLGFGGGGAPMTFSMVNPAAIAEPKALELATTPEVDELGSWKQVEKELQEHTPRVERSFLTEFGVHEDIILENLKDKDTARKKIHARAEKFATKFAESVYPEAMRAYDQQLSQVRNSKGFKVFQTKDSEADRNAKLDALRQRQAEFIKGDIAGNQKTRFVGYTDTMMSRVYTEIERGYESGENDRDVAVRVRNLFEKFTQTSREAYPGQAMTIVRTEYQSALAKAQANFAQDLASVSKRMRKVWLSRIDDRTRDSHEALDSNSVEAKSSEIMDMPFANGLRYPKDPATNDAAEVINCRCTIRYQVTEWE